MRWFKGMCGVALAFAMTAGGVQAQDRGPVSFEVRGSYSLPIGDFGDDNVQGADSDFGWGGDVIFSVTDGFGIYGGWAQNNFDCGVCSGDADYDITGFEGGVKILFPREDRALPWARAGLVASKTTLETDGVDFESDRNLGFQASVGVDIPLSDMVSLSPALRFESIGNDFEIDGDDLPLFDDDKVNYFAVDVGLHFHFHR